MLMHSISDLFFMIPNDIRLVLNKVLRYATMLSCIVLCSCADELNYSNTSEQRIIFEVSSSNEWVDSRSSGKFGNSEIADLNVIQGHSESYELPLFLHSISKTEYYSGNVFSNTISSRGQIINDVGSYGAFQLYAFTNLGDYYNPDYINGDVIIKQGNGWPSERYWPSQSCEISFFAYSPISVKNDIESEVDNLNIDFPYLHYTVPESLESQKDLFVADSKIQFDPSLGYPSIPLKMKHSLTCIQFKINIEKGFEPGEITRITLKNIKRKGTYDFSKEDNSEHKDKNHWVINDDSNWDFNYDLSFFTNNKEGNNDTLYPFITDESIAFFMLPQTLGSDAEVEIEFVDAINSATPILS